MKIRKARNTDLATLIQIETHAFDAARRASTRSLRRSLRSDHQRVLVAETDGRAAAFAVVWVRRLTWRVYDLAVDPAHQGQGLGRALLGRIEQDARAAGAQRIVLEADAQESRLGSYYQRQGFAAGTLMPDYYGPDRHAKRLQKRL